MNKLTSFLSPKKNTSSAEDQKNVEQIEEELIETIQKEKEARVLEETEKSIEVDNDESTAVEAETIVPIPPLRFDSVSFYSQPVRKVSFNEKCYFVLGDVVSITGTIGLTEYLDKLKRSPAYKEGVSQLVITLPSISIGKTEYLECIDIKGINVLLPILQQDKRFFPGPFPNWIKQLSEA